MGNREQGGLEKKIVQSSSLQKEEWDEGIAGGLTYFKRAGLDRPINYQTLRDPNWWKNLGRFYLITTITGVVTVGLLLGVAWGLSQIGEILSRPIPYDKSPYYSHPK